MKKNNNLFLILTVIAAFTGGYLLSLSKPAGLPVETTTVSETATAISAEILTTETSTSAEITAAGTETSTAIISAETTTPATETAVTTSREVTTATPVLTTVIASEEEFFSSKSSEQIGDVEFVAEKGVNEKFYQELKDIYNSFPDRLKKAKKITTTPENLATKFGFKTRTVNGVIGGASSGEEIYISTMTKTLKRTLAHELGHCVDCELGWISQTNEVHNIYVKDYPALAKEDVNFYSEKEYFASSTAMYFIMPDRLKKVAPDTFNYLEKTLNV